mmetsp:Transcript_12954/g.27318  ORF Transcript_12954/g.27318 Transcript_12954/m.27318 type:complete len:358 (+) Transcript_12954:485-1558(+)
MKVCVPGNEHLALLLRLPDAGVPPDDGLHRLAGNQVLVGVLLLQPLPLLDLLSPLAPLVGRFDHFHLPLLEPVLVLLHPVQLRVEEPLQVVEVLPEAGQLRPPPPGVPVIAFVLVPAEALPLLPEPRLHSLDELLQVLVLLLVDPVLVQLVPPLPLPLALVVPPAVDQVLQIGVVIRIILVILIVVKVGLVITQLRLQLHEAPVQLCVQLLRRLLRLDALLLGHRLRPLPFLLKALRQRLIFLPREAVRLIHIHFLLLRLRLLLFFLGLFRFELPLRDILLLLLFLVAFRFNVGNLGRQADFIRAGLCLLLSIFFFLRLLKGIVRPLLAALRLAIRPASLKRLDLRLVLDRDDAQTS